jgi:hypothetical protein
MADINSLKIHKWLPNGSLSVCLYYWVTYHIETQLVVISRNSNAEEEGQNG